MIDTVRLKKRKSDKRQQKAGVCVKDVLTVLSSCILMDRTTGKFCLTNLSICFF